MDSILEMSGFISPKEEPTIYCELADGGQITLCRLI